MERNNLPLKISKHNNWSPNKLVIENGQLIYPEEKFRIENHKSCSSAIISFREWRAKLEKGDEQITASNIPKEYIELIAILAHESDEPLSTLVLRLNELLSPFETENEVLSYQIIRATKQIIKLFAHRERYGIADSAVLSIGAPETIPKRLTFYRWQLKDTTVLPLDALKIAIKRKEKRKLFSSILTDTVLNLTVEERKTLFDDETGTFVMDLCPREPERTSTAKKEGELFGENFFSSIKNDEYTTVAPYTTISTKRKLCPNFHTILYLGLKDKNSFLHDFLLTVPKRRRGIRYKEKEPLDIMKLIWSEDRTENQDVVLKFSRLKLLHFHENVRPSFYGTFTKAFTETVITGRRPFAKNPHVLNYDEDSEAEWDYDVDDDDVHVLGFSSDAESITYSPSDDDSEPIAYPDSDPEPSQEPDDRWVVPEGYLSADEGVYVRTRKKTRHGVMSRPARWPISGNKHFPMKPVIIGPSFEAANEPENHPLSDFKAHFLHTYSSHMNPFDELLSEDEDNVKETLSISMEPTNELRPPLFQREVDKLMTSTKNDLVQLILNNKTKTMMGLVSLLKARKEFNDYTIAQIQAMIHDLATQEIRGQNKEYNWYLRS